MKILLIHNTENLKQAQVFAKLLKRKIKGKFKLVDISKQLNNSNIEDILTYQKKLSKECKNMDIIVYDYTKDSDYLPLVYYIAKITGKPLFLIMDNGQKIDISEMDNNSIKMYICKYSFDNLEAFIEKFLEKTEDLLEKKFILQIDSDLSRYLHWRAEKLKIPKAEIVRQAIFKKIKSDKEYKNTDKLKN